MFIKCLSNYGIQRQATPNCFKRNFFMKFWGDPNIKSSFIFFLRFLTDFFAKIKIVINCLMKLDFNIF